MDSNGEKNLCYYHQPGNVNLIAETIGDILDKTADLYGDYDAVVMHESNLRRNYKQLNAEVDKFAAGLLAIGVKKGDRIGIWSPNYYEWVVTQYAAAKAGLILVNINPGYQPRELIHCLKKVNMRVIVSAEKFKTQNYYEILTKVIPSLPSSQPGEIKDKNVESLSHVIMISANDYGGTYKFWDVAKMATDNHFNKLKEIQKSVHFDDPYNIQFTSGTTGNPKGATLTHFNLINNANLVGRKLGYHKKTHRICICVPLYHCFGCVSGGIAGTLFAACQVYPSGVFNGKLSAAAAQNEKCTSIYGTPTMFIDILNLADFNDHDFSSLSTGIMAGATCPEEILKDVMTKLHAPKMTVCYGCTETSPMITQTMPEDSEEMRITTVGRPIENTEVQIVNPETGYTVSYGEPGEIWIRGYLVMLGYWEEPNKTKESITPTGWYKSGDLGIGDEKGYIKVVGRIKDMIIRGGENLYPREIEEFLHTHPKIAEVQVVGVPDPRLGEELCAWIHLKREENLTVDDVKAFCKGQLAHFKIPRYVKFVDNFPTTVTGKVQKFVIREIATNELGLNNK